VPKWGSVEIAGTFRISSTGFVKLADSQGGGFSCGTAAVLFRYLTMVRWFRHHARGATRDSGKRSLLKPIGYALGAVLAAILLVWAVLFITKGRFLKHPAERIASSLSGREVKVAGDFQLYFNIINIKFLAEGLSIANPPWAKEPYLFQSRLVDSSISTIPLLWGERRFRWLRLDGANVALEWNGKRENTWTFGAGDGEPFEMPKIRRADITNTRVRYTDPAMQLFTDLRIGDIASTSTRIRDAIGFGGSGQSHGVPFTINGKLTSPNETIAGGRNNLVMRIATGSSAVGVAGTLPGATELEGADLRLTAKGQNLQTPFTLLGIVVPPTRSFNVRSHVTKAGDEWRLTRINGRFGTSDIAGRMTVTVPETEERLKLDADLQTRVLDILDAGPFIGYSPERLDKQGGSGAITVRGGHPTVLPDAPLAVESLKNFDADVRYRVTRIRADYFPISNLDLTLDLERSRLALSPFTFDIAGGHLASDIIINARSRPVATDYDIRLSPTPMGNLLGKFGVEASGTTGVVKARVKMRGRGDTVHESLASSNGRIAIILPKGTFWTRNVQLAELDVGTFVQKLVMGKLKKPVEINCGLIAFTVRDGIGAADPILIDTDKNVIVGRGAFSFKDESLAFGMRADAKTFSLFSAQSPVGVNGYFAAPGINPISPQLLARAGAGAVAGLALSPLAVVIAFIDPGDAKATACGPVLEGARATAQRTAKGKPRKDVGKGTPAIN
jgi:uncharacterized protein involved in outer membrane biogenesis